MINSLVLGEIKMKKNTAGIIITLAIICLTLTGCFNSDNTPRYGDGKFSGEVLGQGDGFVGKIRVTLTLKKGIITKLDIAHIETDHIGGAFIELVKPLIVEANSFEIDAITSATCRNTAAGLLEAGRNAIAQIPSVNHVR
jgi:uncharacterized protein with FMN-binding domain